MQVTKSVVQQAWDIAEPICKERGLILWDVEYKREGGDYVLRVFIDREDEPVSIEDCEYVSRAMDEPLDEQDFIKESYCLEVSSPGLERTLCRPAHFAAFLGALVDVKLYKKFGDDKKLTATLDDYDEEGNMTLVLADGQQVVFGPKEVASVKVHFEF